MAYKWLIRPIDSVDYNFKENNLGECLWRFAADVLKFVQTHFLLGSVL